MDEQGWIVTIHWSQDQQEQRVASSTKELLSILDHHAFCRWHDCPIPLAVTIRQAS